jgi:hypothetical protein
MSSEIMRSGILWNVHSWNLRADLTKRIQIGYNSSRWVNGDPQHRKDILMKKELPSLEDMLFQILGANGLSPDEIKKTVNDAMTSEKKKEVNGE